MNKLSANLNFVFNIVSQHDGFFSGYNMYIVQCDCYTATRSYPSWIT